LEAIDVYNHLCLEVIDVYNQIHILLIYLAFIVPDVVPEKFLRFMMMKWYLGFKFIT